jgi:hypothetical protein
VEARHGEEVARVAAAQLEDAVRGDQVYGWQEDGLATGLLCPLYDLFSVLGKRFFVQVGMCVYKAYHHSLLFES